MDNYVEFKGIFDKYDGVIRTSEFQEAGYHHKYLKKLVDEGLVRKIKRGYYEWHLAVKREQANNGSGSNI